ncbi:MAG: hypothetical protein H7338_25470 [Candidatus Sericytochromatia bacterium]|nr:hypothetical protein [Candidatus Sericytochromatia bacterium]
MVKWACTGLLIASILAGCSGGNPTTPSGRPSVAGIRPVSAEDRMNDPIAEPAADDRAPGETVVDDVTAKAPGPSVAPAASPALEPVVASPAPSAGLPAIVVPSTTPVAVAPPAKSSLLKSVGGVVKGLFQKVVDTFKKKKSA